MANLSMTCGDSRTFQLAVTIEDAPVDLTGVQVLEFVLSRAGGAVVARWGLGSGVTVPSPATGVALLTVTPSMTAFARNNYLSLAYAWRLVDVLGNVTGALDTGGFTLTTGS